jgi:thiol-disulfide isomerase/thioredoxin
MAKSKTITGVLLAAFALAGIAAWGVKNFREAAPTPEAAPGDSVKEVVYYFYTNYRCPNCMKLEAYTKEAVEKVFAEEIKRGTVAFSAVNVEKKGNEHFVQDYQLKTKSVVLVEPAQKDRWKNLEKIWKLVGDKDAYLNYIEQEARRFLAGSP